MQLSIAWICLLLLLLCGLASCAATGGNPSAQVAPHAQCVVCKHNADLACLNVKITDETPRSVYNGQTYYFCTQECKRTFDQQPSKYAVK